MLKDTLEKVDIGYCHHVEGNFMDLADFPHLRDLNLFKTAITGDVREINVNDFQSEADVSPIQSLWWLEVRISAHFRLARLRKFNTSPCETQSNFVCFVALEYFTIIS